jgi:hypothetical protein
MTTASTFLLGSAIAMGICKSRSRPFSLSSAGKPSALGFGRHFHT